MLTTALLDLIAELIKNDGHAPMNRNSLNSRDPLRLRSGFTLIEVVTSMGVAAITIGAILSGYILSAQRSDWSACSVAAQSLAMQRVEQTRAAKWDTMAYPVVDQLVSSNFPVFVAVLDVPVVDTNVVYATNQTTITTVTTDPPLKMIRVDCSWSLMSRGPFTNTVITYRSPDQ